MIRTTSSLAELTLPGSESLPLDGFGLDDLKPTTAVAPCSPGEMARALALVADKNLACVPWGGGTQQHLGRLPSRYDVALSTNNLNQLVDLQPGDLTVTAEAGMTFSELQAVLAPHGQFVALESRQPDRETIGGILATGYSALTRFAYGAPRDQVIGIQVAMPDGSLVRGGGRVVKNVAGYDLCKLFTGSLGTLGIITEATFRVRPLPTVSRSWTGSFPSRETAETALEALLESSMQPTYLQAVDPGLSESLLGPAVGDAKFWSLIVGCDGDEALGEWMVSEADRLTNPVVSRAVDGENDASLRQRLTHTCGAAGELSVKLNVRSSDVLKLMDQCSQFSAESGGLPIKAIAAAGNGVIYFNLDPEAARDPGLTDNSSGGALALVEWLADKAATLNGTMVVLRSPAPFRNQLPLWGRALPTLPLMRRIRERFDPRRCLNRERWPV